MGKTLYILKSHKHGRFYVGSTDDLERRFKEHNSGHTKSTKSGMPWEVVFTEVFAASIDGLRAEKKIKALKSRKIIESLVNGTMQISDLINN
jgi:putative endonuclease